MLVVYSSELDSNNEYKPDQYLDGNFELVEFSCHNSFYNIHDQNNNLPYQQVSLGVSSVSLTNGFYTGEQLRVHLETQLQSQISGSFTVSFNSITGKYTFTDATAFRFNDEDSNGCLNVIGFTSGGSYATTQTSSQVANLIPYEDIYVNLKEDRQEDILRKNFVEYSFHIPLPNSDFGSIIRYRQENDTSQLINFHKEAGITITFVDKNNKNVEFQGSDWKLVLRRA